MRHAVIHDTWLPVTRDTFTRDTLVLQAAIRFTRQDFRRVSVNGKFNAIRLCISSAECNWCRAADYLRCLSRMRKIEKSITLRVLNTRGLCGPYGRRATSADDRCGWSTFSLD